MEKITKEFENKLEKLKDLEFLNNLKETHKSSDISLLLNYWRDIVIKGMKEKESILKNTLIEKEEYINSLLGQLKPLKQEVENLRKDNIDMKKEIEIHSKIVEKDKLILEYSNKNVLDELKEKLTADYEQKTNEAKFIFEKQTRKQENDIQEELATLNNQIIKLKSELAQVRQENIELYTKIESNNSLRTQDYENYKNKLNAQRIEITAKYEHQILNKTINLEDQIHEKDQLIKNIKHDLHEKHTQELNKLNERMHSIEENIQQKETTIIELTQQIKQYVSETSFVNEKFEKQKKDLISYYEQKFSKIIKSAKTSAAISRLKKYLLPIAIILFAIIIILLIKILTTTEHTGTIISPTTPDSSSLTSKPKPLVKRQNIYPITYNNPTLFAFDGKYLWITDWLKQAIFKHKINDDQLALVTEYTFSDIHPTSISRYKNSLWTIDSWNLNINKHKLDDKLSITETYSYPGSNPAGIFFDGIYLWVCDTSDNMIYKLRQENNQMIIAAKYPSKNSNTLGIFLDKKQNIWTVDGNLKMVFKHNTDKNLSITEKYKLPDKFISYISISGIGWDDKSIWISEDNKPRLIRIYIDQLEKISE